MIATSAQHYHAEPDLDNYRDMSVGQILQKTREYYGQTLPQVEANLRIRASQLQALEQENIDQLPGRVYAIGFVRAYSEYLGLDGDKMVYLFKSHVIGKGMRPDLNLPAPVEESKAPNLPLIVGSLIGVILLIAYVSIFHAPAINREEIPPVPRALVEKRESLMRPADELLGDMSLSDSLEADINNEQEATITTAQEQPKAPQLTAPQTLELVAIRDSWVEIKDSNQSTVLRKVMRPAERFEVKEGDFYTMTTGNAGGLVIFLNGERIGKLGDNAQVMRGIRLSVKEFSKE